MESAGVVAWEPFIPAVDKRVRVSILGWGGLAPGRSVPEVDQINYIGRVTVPVLMLNSRHDAIEPLESAQLPMFRMLGTPPHQKRHVLSDGGHGVAPANAYRKEILDWLDRFLGPGNH
jgi:pimeloyl-ACP methyl ester carboxylesterase